MRLNAENNINEQEMNYSYIYCLTIDKRASSLISLIEMDLFYICMIACFSLSIFSFMVLIIDSVFFIHIIYDIFNLAFIFTL